MIYFRKYATISTNQNISSSLLLMTSRYTVHSTKERLPIQWALTLVVALIALVGLDVLVSVVLPQVLTELRDAAKVHL